MVMPRLWRVIGAFAMLGGGAGRAGAQTVRPNPCTLITTDDAATVTRTAMAPPQMANDMSICTIASFQAVQYSLADTAARVTLRVESARLYDPDYFSTQAPNKQPLTGLGDEAVALTDSAPPMLRVRRRWWVYTIRVDAPKTLGTDTQVILDTERRLADRVLNRAP
jgi:hypothetical protein